MLTVGVPTEVKQDERRVALQEGYFMTVACQQRAGGESTHAAT